MSSMRLRMRRMRNSLQVIGKPSDAFFHAAFPTVYPRIKRMEEISQLQKASIHNHVYPIQKPDYAREVTEASSKHYVFVNLTSSMSGNVESRVLSELWRQLAAKYGEIKFCESRANMCIEGYPDRNTPTILAYKNGEIAKQAITLREFNGPRTTLRGMFRTTSRSPSLTLTGQILKECLSKSELSMKMICAIKSKKAVLSQSITTMMMMTMMIGIKSLNAIPRKCRKPATFACYNAPRLQHCW